MPDNILDEEDQALLAEIEEDVENAVERYTDDPLENISAIQMKAALLMVQSPHLTDRDVGSMVGRSVDTIRNWKAKEEFKNYLSHLKHKTEERSLQENAERNALISDRVFSEILDRLVVEPDHNRDLHEDHTINEREMYYERFPQFMSFKDIMKVWEGVDKRTRLDKGEATSRVEQNNIVQEARDRFEALMVRRKKIRRFKKENDISDFQSVHEIDLKKEDSEDEVLEAEFVEDSDSEEEVEEEILMRYSIEL